MTYEIIGAKGKPADVNTVIETTKGLNEKHGLTIQLFDSEMVFGREHLESAVFHAERAMSVKTNVAKSIGMEIILYASGERQINVAIQKMGIKESTNDFGILIYDFHGTLNEHSKIGLINGILGELNLTRDDSVLTGDRSVLERFGIEKEELESVPEPHWGNLVLERVAMVDVIK